MPKEYSMDIFNFLKRESFAGKICFLNLNSRSRYLVQCGQPLGLMLLMGVCRDLSIPYGFIDADVSNMIDEEIIAAINKGGYDYVGIPLVSLGAVKIFPFLDRIKRETNVTLIVGGPLPSADTQWMMESCRAIDYAVLGEGETVLPLLLHTIKKKKSLENIPGIAYWDGDNLIINKPCKEFLQADMLPMPDFDIIDYKSYPGTRPVRAWPSVNLFATRGCPYNCTYCCNPIWKHKPNLIPVPTVINWLEHLAQRGIREVFFIDDTFNINHDWFNELCHSIIKKGLNGKMIFKAHFRADLTHREGLKLARKAGFWLVHYGAESGDDDILKYYKKGETAKEIADAVKWTGAEGLRTMASFIIGAPIDTVDSLLRTANFIREVDPTYIPVQLLYPFMGAKISEDIIVKGLLTSKEIRTYDHTSPAIRTLTLSTKELLDILNFMHNDILRFKKSAIYSIKRQRELKDTNLSEYQITKKIAYEIDEMESIGVSGKPKLALLDQDNDEDFIWMSDEIKPFTEDIRLRENEWHESEGGLRWSRPVFGIPFFLKEEKRYMEIHWASMRPETRIKITFNYDLSMMLKITDPDWRIERIRLPRPLKGAIRTRFEILDPFFAPNDPRELGMALKSIRFV